MKQEKEEDELKKKPSLEKQGSIVERILKRCKPSFQKKVSTKSVAFGLPAIKAGSLSESATLSMDCTLPSSNDIMLEDILNHVVGPRDPLRKDPILDYDVSSDEAWEEEEPGESFSDCDKDEEECLDECSKCDGESEDGFFEPDGYVLEDETLILRGLIAHHAVRMTKK